jgi:hypothetical protein
MLKGLGGSISALESMFSGPANSTNQEGSPT